MADNINHQTEGTRFATDVSIYDPETGDIITSMTELLAASSGGLSPAADVADATDDTDVVDQLNALLASLRTAGILE